MPERPSNIFSLPPFPPNLNEITERYFIRVEEVLDHLLRDLQNPTYIQVVGTLESGNAVLAEITAVGATTYSVKTINESGVATGEIITVYPVDKDSNNLSGSVVPLLAVGEEISIFKAADGLHYTTFPVEDLAEYQPLDSDLTAIAALSGVNGDIMYYNSGWQRLAKGDNTEVLTLAAGLPSWAAAGGGDVSKDGTMANNYIAVWTSDGGLSGYNDFLFNGADLTFYNAVNDGNPEIRLGALDAEEFHMQVVFDSGAQTLDYVLFETDVVSGTAHKGKFVFDVDGSTRLTINDDGITCGRGNFTNGDSIKLGSIGTITGDIILYNDTNSYTTTISSGVAEFSLTFILPVDDGIDGYVLSTNGAGVLSWAVSAVSDESIEDLCGAMVDVGGSGTQIGITVEYEDVGAGHGYVDFTVHTATT